MSKKNRRALPGSLDVAGSPEDERLPVGRSFMYGLQHVLTMYGGIIAPPIILGGAAGVTDAEKGLLIASCLFIGGLATILQSVGIPFFGSKLPLVQGTSFAAVATMLAIVNGGGGLPAVFGAVLAASLIGFVITPFFAMILRFFPPVVTGVVITAIGLSLIPVAGNWIMGGNAAADDYGSMANVGLAGLTLLIIVVLSKLGSATISRLSILLALIIGTVIAIPLGMADFSSVLDGPVFAIPTPLAFGAPVFDPAAIVSMLVVVLVILTETTADILAVGEITGARVDSRRIANGLRADMAASAVSPLLNSFTQSAFAQNVGLVAITGVKSRFVVTAGGVILVILGVLPILGRVAAAIPMPVLGGAGIVLFGTVAASGIRTLSKVDYRNNMNLIIVAASLAFGMLPVVKTDIYHQFPDWFEVIFHSGISSAAIMAVLLNLIFNELTLGNVRKNASVFVASPPRMVREDELEALEDGDTFVGGKLIAADGNEVPIVRVNAAGNQTTSIHISSVDRVAPDTPAQGSRTIRKGFRR
ncbi:uracil permease [Microbacterium barkeri]|uniref:Uracil permease n=1 Tax=Microbacterium barkeri TaxID=33917 RepID=A0A9W6H5B0_9MICO|nr:MULTISPECIES: nucleobase:cation symporter-2 family protein [Microbacterium]MDI6944239.1 nucleobase:cation symporter-2 family protein [Microbacterium barkeri]MDR6876812.1 NCS2 family nucleobase:cation symporter-2 [Microbacterium barkeri]WRH16813.1 purine permease [Microbacterium sp. JZ37]GLJ62254.1 uracil permease [Microbacterium barkeri]